MIDTGELRFEWEDVIWVGTTCSQPRRSCREGTVEVAQPEAVGPVGTFGTPTQRGRRRIQRQ